MTIEEIPVVNGLKWVRSRPQQFFFGKDMPTPVDLLSWLMSDVVVLGRGECVIRSSGSWWIIGSDVDWLTNPTCTITELFHRVVAEPRHGVNSMRGEILVGGFCSDISVIGPTGVARIAGDELDDAALQKAAGLKHAIVFRLPPQP